MNRHCDTPTSVMGMAGVRRVFADIRAREAESFLWPSSMVFGFVIPIIIKG
jgi:hypothetical protein